MTKDRLQDGKALWVDLKVDWLKWLNLLMVDMMILLFHP